MSKKRKGLFSRRWILKILGGLAAIPAMSLPFLTTGCFQGKTLAKRQSWPSKSDWDLLRERVEGRLFMVESPLKACVTSPGSSAARAAIEKMKNPFYIEDHSGATQSTGWLDSWKTEVSPYMVAAENSSDIVAAVNFARKYGVKLVVKGTGHDYLGRSNAADSLLIWTHHMRKVTIHESFVPAGGSGPGVPAVTAQAGARWLEAYDAVTNKHGRYVQGGGCTSVGAVGGFMQGGGFGSFSKKFGMGSAGMLEAEVVLADGTVVVANEYQNEDLFWALRGGGGGTFGVVTRMTLLTHEIPKTFGVFMGSIRAGSDESFRELLEAFVRLYADSLGNERWGEQVKVKGDNSIELSMLFQGLTEAEAREVWKPFLAHLESRPREFEVEINVIIMPAREMWNYKYMADKHPELLTRDERKGQPKGQYWWASNQAEVSRYIYSYQSRWVPRNLFEPARAKRLAELFFQMSRHHSFSLHFNKGQAGASAEAVERGRKTSINPAVFDAAAQIIMNDGERDAYPDIAAHAPDSGRGREALRRMNAAMKLLRDATPGAGTYSSEADYHEPDWQESFWGTNYPKLLSIKRKYDPAGLFRTHHSVGSEI